MRAPGLFLRRGPSHVTAFFEQLSRLGIGRLSLIFGLTAGVALALILLLVNPGSGSQALLYSGLEARDAASVAERLEGAGIPYELRDGGSAIYVPAAQVDQARLRVASGGALSFGSVGYEIFDSNDGIGATSFVQNVNARRALEGELARSINAISAVSGARVHLVLPERRLFSREQQEPSASVVISVRGQLSPGQVSTISNLIATAVPGLSPSRITIADDQGRLLASPSDGDTFGGVAIEERRTGLEAALRQRILDVVEGVVGPGAARVVVTAQVNRESLTETRLEFDPNLQVEVSREVQSEETSEPAGRQEPCPPPKTSLVPMSLPPGRARWPHRGAARMCVISRTRGPPAPVWSRPASCKDWPCRWSSTNARCGARTARRCSSRAPKKRWSGSARWWPPRRAWT